MEDGLVGGGDLAVDHRIQRLVVNSHQLGSVFRNSRRFGNDSRHRLALITRAVHGHRDIKNLVARRGPISKKGSMSVDISWPVSVHTTPGSASASETSTP